MIAGLVVLIVLQVLSIIANIMMIGKPRQPITQGTATAAVIISGFIIAFYISLIYVLSGTQNG